jgi:hypothetical protein
MIHKPFILRSYDNAQTASQDLLILSGKGVEAVLQEEASLALVTDVSHYKGRVKLLIDQSDVYQALDVLRERWTPSASPDPHADVEVSYQCPKCESFNIEIKRSFLTMLMSFTFCLTTYPVPVRKKRCSQCGHTWI